MSDLKPADYLQEADYDELEERRKMKFAMLKKSQETFQIRLKFGTPEKFDKKINALSQVDPEFAHYIRVLEGNEELNPKVYQ